jgi:hypothetical protein
LNHKVGRFDKKRGKLWQQQKKVTNEISRMESRDSDDGRSKAKLDDVRMMCSLQIYTFMTYLRQYLRTPGTLHDGNPGTVQLQDRLDVSILHLQPPTSGDGLGSPTPAGRCCCCCCCCSDVHLQYLFLSIFHHESRRRSYRHCYYCCSLCTCHVRCSMYVDNVLKLKYFLMAGWLAG